MILALALGIPGAYAIARLPFFGRRQVSGVFLAAYLFPAILMAIPLFVGFTRVGLRGSLVGLILVYTAQTVPVAIYMLRNYFETVPVSIEEAGLVDGLTRIGVLRQISLRLAMPSIMSTGLFVFMIAWNEFLFALLFLVDRRERWTVSLGLSQLSGSVEVPDHRADGRLGRPHLADHHLVLRHRATADRRTHRRRREVTPPPRSETAGHGVPR